MQILKFYSETCVPCKTLTTMLAGEPFNIEAVNINTDPVKTLKYNVRSVPTLVFIDSEGEALHRVTGLVTGETVKEILNDLQGNTKT